MTDSTPEHDAAVRARLQRSGLPAIYRAVSLEDVHPDLRDSPVVQAVTRWAAHGGALFVHGGVGRGKTWLAAAALRRAMETEPRCRWISVPQLAFGLAADFGSPAHARSADVLANAGRLVLDDLGQEPPSDQLRSALFTAINGRLDAGAALLITSNLLPSELGERYGAWLPSRLAAFSASHRLGGPDRRLSPTPRSTP